MAEATKLEKILWPKPCAVCGHEVSEPGSYLTEMPDIHGVPKKVLVHDGCIEQFMAALKPPKKTVGATPTDEDFMYDALTMLTDCLRSQSAMQKIALEDIRLSIIKGLEEIAGKLDPPKRTVL